ncbi:hypothetical protein B0H10DRAFT_66513 [Mycena sp. CBHHK59/15]|nr:hypothetical protein B0H10DRAFT_66513 [Mycena sp. CBHHK59/15]
MGRWLGEVQVGGVRVRAWFEVFDCGGAFDVILGKPWLHAVLAIHEYGDDTIRIRAGDGEAVIQNEDSGDAVEEGPETAEEMRERVWTENEVARLARKVEKERERKRAHLERRAEQPLPFPAIGHSPSIWTAPAPRKPRPFPAPKTAPAPDHIAAIAGVGETDPETQLEDEWARINVLRALAGPWAETRFAEYLTVETSIEADDVAAATCEEKPSDTGTEEVRGCAIPKGETARKRRAANQRLWAKTTHDAQLINQITSHWQPATPDDGHTVQTRRKADTARYVEEYALRQQTKILAEFLGTDLKDSSREQMQARVTSEVRIRRLQSKLDEMRAMAYPGIDVTTMRPGDTAVNAIGDVLDSVQLGVHSQNRCANDPAGWSRRTGSIHRWPSCYFSSSTVLHISGKVSRARDVVKRKKPSTFSSSFISASYSGISGA